VGGRLEGSSHSSMREYWEEGRGEAMVVLA
jgi:hypothetical protein